MFSCANWLILNTLLHVSVMPDTWTQKKCNTGWWRCRWFKCLSYVHCGRRLLLLQLIGRYHQFCFNLLLSYWSRRSPKICAWAGQEWAAERHQHSEIEKRNERTKGFNQDIQLHVDFLFKRLVHFYPEAASPQRAECWTCCQRKSILSEDSRNFHANMTSTVQVLQGIIEWSVC